MSANLASKPKLRLHINDLDHEATTVFLSVVDTRCLIPDAVHHILRHLYTPHGHHTIPPVRSVTIVLRAMPGVAYTTGLDLDDLHKEIHLSLDYVGSFSKQPARFKHETVGVITHEMVHCFQHNGKGTAPGGLIEGIADYVRLKAGLAPPHWKKEKQRIGHSWDSGYERTAWFLEWLEETKGPGTVSKINETLADTKYDDDTFWQSLFGESVDALWRKYKDGWEEAQEEKTHGSDSLEPDHASGSGNVSATSEASETSEPDDSEPELIDLTPAEKSECQGTKDS